MPEFDAILMSLVIFVPTAFALVLMVPWIFPRGSDEYMRWWSLIGTALTLGLSLCMFISYYQWVVQKGPDVPSSLLDKRVEEANERANLHEAHESRDWVARYAWIPRFNIQYYLGVDGISMPLILLTTVLCFLAMLASWNIDRYVRGYCILFLLLETGMLGTFFALDFFLFYIFWEVMLLPMYFLIGVWGGPRREYAAIKFFLYTLLGSVFILIALLGFYFTDVRDFVSRPGATRAVANQPVHTFDIVLLQRAGRVAADVINGATVQTEGMAAANNPDRLAAARERLNQPFFTKTFQIIMFLLLFVGFAIKVPVFPFHTWLPDAHVEAPTPISMILAGVLLKMGGYGDPAHRLPDLPLGGGIPGELGRLVRHHQHRLWRLRRHGADRLQEAGRLQLRQPHGLRHPGHRRLVVDRTGNIGRGG